MTLTNDERRAIVRGFGTAEAVRAYLPANYRLAAYREDDGRVVATVAGTDHAGWTLEDYVVPRLASGLYTVEVLR